MDRKQIVIEIREGVVLDIYSTDPDLQVTLVDWDCEDWESPLSVEIETAEGAELAYVVSTSPQPLAMLAGSNVERALEAALLGANAC